MTNLKSWVAGLMAVSLWSAAPIFIKLGTTEENLTYLLVIRFFISSLFFIPYLKHIASYWQELTKSERFFLCLTMGVNYYFQGKAMHYIPASWYVIVFSMNPLLTLLLLKIKLNRQRIMGLALTLIGTLGFLKDDFKTEYWLAFVYIFIGMVAWAFYTLQARRLQDKFNDMEITALTQWASLASCFLIWLGLGLPQQPLNSIQWGSIALLGLNTPLAFFLFTYCLRNTPRFGIASQYLEPVFGALLGVLTLNESLSWLQVLGALAIIWGAVQIEKES